MTYPSPVIETTTIESEPAGPPTSATSTPAQEVERLQRELTWLDCKLRDLVAQRASIARKLIACRRAAQEPLYAHTEEIAALRHYQVLGPEGKELAVLLLRMARNPRPATAERRG